MRAIALTAAALLLCTFAQGAPEFLREFTDFKAKFGRKYASEVEEAHRFKIFTENMKEAQRQAAVNPHATFGVNEFADRSKAEFKTRHNAEKAYKELRKAAKQLKEWPISAEEKLAAQGKSQDWRPKGAVTPVKNQGDCGSCWSFSTTGGIEGQWFLAGNPLTSVSEQELVSCDTIDSGCNGGLMVNAYTWLLNAHNGSIVTEASYPYVSGTGSVPACSMSGTQFGAQISSYQNIAGDENGAMAAFVYSNGPLSIAVYAESWQTYTGGIVTNCPQQQLDHGVLIVGYDDNNNPPYWIIKNSWGPGWGESGYIRVGKGTGQCNIGQYQTSSIVKGSGPTAPPSPPSPTPAPNSPPSPTGGASFTQKTCTDAQCSQCTSVSFPQNQCIPSGAGSYSAVCATDALIVSSYTSSDCSGTATTTSNAINTCSSVFSSNGEQFTEIECGSSPSPPSPTNPVSPPPPAPTPSPTPAGGTFIQEQCQDAACTQGCEQQTFPQNSCLQLSSGGSAIAVCQPSALQLTVYELSSTCTGPSQVVSQPINTCEQSSSGNYFENICSSSKPGQLSSKAMHFSARKMVKRN